MKPPSRSRRAREARDNAGVHRIAAEAEHHRNRRRERRSAGSRATSYNKINPRAQQFLDQGRKPAVIPPGITDLDDEVAVLAIAEGAHPREETCKIVVRRRTCRQISEARRLSALLAARRERPSGGCGEEHHERAALYPAHSRASGNPGAEFWLAPAHSMISSASC
jgi:hypothetical protein